jgi:hypothetical protein
MKVKRPERPIDPADWQRRMNLRLRAEYIAGAEEEWRKRTGAADDGRGAGAGAATLSGGRVSDQARELPNLSCAPWVHGDESGLGPEGRGNDSRVSGRLGHRPGGPRWLRPPDTNYGEKSP